MSPAALASPPKVPPTILRLFPVGARAAIISGPVGVLAMLLQVGFILFYRPIMDWMTKQDVGFLGRFIRWVVKPIVGQLDAFRTFMLKHLGDAANAALRPIVNLVNQFAVLAQHTYEAVADLSLETWRAFDLLTTQTIPREIKQALDPIRVRLDRQTDRLDTLEALNRNVGQVVANGLRALPWGVAGSYVGNIDHWWDSYRHLWNQTFDFLAPKLDRLATETVPALERELARLTARLDAIGESGLDTLRESVAVLETWRTTVVNPQLDALRQAVDTLGEMVTGVAGISLTALFERVAALETELEARIAAATEALTTRVTQLEAQVQELIGTATATLAARVAALEAQMAEFIGTATATLAARVTQLEAQLADFIGTTTATLAERVTALETALETQIRLQLEGLLGRIEAIETQLRTEVLPEIARLGALLEPVAFAALVLAAMRTVAPNLFCRNVTKATTDICATEEGLLDDLLALALTLVASLSIVEFAREVGAAMGTFNVAIDGFIEER